MFRNSAEEWTICSNTAPATAAHLMRFRFSLGSSPLAVERFIGGVGASEKKDARARASKASTVPAAALPLLAELRQTMQMGERTMATPVPSREHLGVSLISSLMQELEAIFDAALSEAKTSGAQSSGEAVPARLIALLLQMCAFQPSAGAIAAVSLPHYKAPKRRTNNHQRQRKSRKTVGQISSHMRPSPSASSSGRNSPANSDGRHTPTLRTGGASSNGGGERMSALETERERLERELANGHVRTPAVTRRTAAANPELAPVAESESESECESGSEEDESTGDRVLAGRQGAQEQKDEEDEQTERLLRAQGGGDHDVFYRSGGYGKC